jgi:serine/threonine protein kinase
LFPRGKRARNILMKMVFALYSYLITGKLKHVTELRRIKFEDIIRRRIPAMEDKEVVQFAAFLRSMLRYEPAERPQAAELAVDPWLS